MDISQSNFEKINAHLLQYMADGCPRCHTRGFSVNNKLETLPAFTPNAPHIVSSIPVVVVTCNTCGRVELFNAQNLGLQLS